MGLAQSASVKQCTDCFMNLGAQLNHPSTGAASRTGQRCSPGMACSYLPFLDYGPVDDVDSTPAAERSTQEASTANATGAQGRAAATLAGTKQQAAAADASTAIVLSKGLPRAPQAASTRGRGHGAGRAAQRAPDSSQERMHADELQQYARRRRKAVLLSMLRLLEHGAKDAEDLQHLMQPMSGEELMQVAEERALAKLCGNPLCSNKFEWDGPRWTISDEAIERPEGECFCCKACTSYIAELARQLGDPMKDLTAEAMAADSSDKLQQQQQARQQQQQQQQQRKLQKPEVAARGKEGPTMLATIQERVPAPMQSITEEADGMPELDPAQLMAEVAAAAKRYSQAGVVEGYVPRSQPRSLAAAAAARAQPVLGAGGAEVLQLQPMVPATSSSTVASKDASSREGAEPSAEFQEGSRRGSLDCTVSERTGDVSPSKQGVDQRGVASSTSGGSSRWSRRRSRDSSSSGQMEAGSRAEARARSRTPEGASPRSILKKDDARQHRQQSQPPPPDADTATATSSSQQLEGQQRRHSVRFAPDVQYQEYRDAYPSSDTAPQRIDTAQPMVGDVIERRTATQPLPTALPRSVAEYGAALRAFSVSEHSAGAAEVSGQLPEQPVLCFTLDDPSSVLEAGGSAEGQLGAQFGQLQLLDAAEDAVGATGGSDAGVAAMPRAMQMWFPPAAGGLGVPVQRASQQQQQRQQRQAHPAAQPAAATPASRHQQETGSSSSKGTPVSTKEQQPGGALPAAKQPPPERPRKFMPVRPVRRSVVMLDAPPDGPLMRQRGPVQAATPEAAVPAAAASETPAAVAATSAAATPLVPGHEAETASISGSPGLRSLPIRATGSSGEPASAAVSSHDEAGPSAAVSLEDENSLSEGDDASEFSSQEWYYDDQGETVEVPQQRQEQQQRRQQRQGPVPGPRPTLDWSDADSDDMSAGERSGEDSEAEATAATQLSSEDDGSDEEGDLRATAPFFGAPPKGFRAVLSPFGTLWTIVHAWVGERTREYVARQLGSPAAADAGAGGEISAAELQAEGKGAGAASSRGPLMPSAPLVQARVALAEAVCGAVPDVLAELHVGVPESEIVKQLVALVRTFRITGALPALPQQQWRLVALLLMRALSGIRVPALAAVFTGRAAGVRLEGVLGRCGFDVAQFDALLDLFEDE